MGAKTGLYLIDLCNEPKITDSARTILSRYDKGISNRKGESSGVLHSPLPRAIINPTKEKSWGDSRRYKEPNEEMYTITASDRHGIIQNSRIRRLTPRECFRLQGVPDEYFERAEKVCSDRQLYMQAGNAVSVPVVYELAKKIKEFM